MKKHNLHLALAQEYIKMALAVGGTKTPCTTALWMAIEQLQKSIKKTERKKK